MAIYWPTPGYKGRTCKLCVLNRWDFNFCIRSSPLRGQQTKQNKFLKNVWLKTHVPMHRGTLLAHWMAHQTGISNPQLQYRPKVTGQRWLPYSAATYPPSFSMQLVKVFQCFLLQALPALYLHAAKKKKKKKSCPINNEFWHKLISDMASTLRA